MRRLAYLVPLVLLFAAGPTLAQTAPSYHGWGLRAGLAESPDQIVLGVHWNLGDVFKNTRFSPNVEVGFGDDATVVAGTAALHYVFNTASTVRPYAGGGVSVGWLDFDTPHGENDSEIEVALKAIGGVEWKMRGNNAFGLELALHVGDIYDVQFMATWTFP